MIKWISGVLYLISILLGNAFVIWFGLVQLGLAPHDSVDSSSFDPWFILVFPAGALWIGLTFSARDFAQRFWGHYKIWYWMISAAIITVIFNWQLAVASICAFIIAEGVDWAVFVLLKKDLKWKIIISNLISCPLDSLVFVMIAFGVSWHDSAVWGQAIIKYLSGLMVIPFIPYINNAYNKMSDKNKHYHYLKPYGGYK